jgi:hypothetical protein
LCIFITTGCPACKLFTFTKLEKTVSSFVIFGSHTLKGTNPTNISEEFSRHSIRMPLVSCLLLNYFTLKTTIALLTIYLKNIKYKFNRVAEAKKPCWQNLLQLKLQFFCCCALIAFMFVRVPACRTREPIKKFTQTLHWLFY